MVAGLPTGVARSDPGGVSGHWIFAPPGGHSVSRRADVRAQADRFVASDRTDLVDPPQPPRSP